MLSEMSATIRELFGDRLQENVMLAPYTSARIGGPADYLLEVRSTRQLAEAVTQCWGSGLEYVVLGGGSNVLVSDRGVRGLVILNRAKSVQFEAGSPPHVRAESGAVLSNLAHRAASLGFGGLEWAATVPGTVGGAVYGNAGAFGGDMAGNLLRAEVLTPDGNTWWGVEEMHYGYRTSSLKGTAIKAVVLNAELRLANSTPQEVQKTISQLTVRRKASQPLGASMGSMFKNPQGDFAGRLIDASGMKGARVGTAEISTVHGNFIINTGDTRADDIRQLLELVQRTVWERSGIKLELEVELIGEW